MWKESVNSRKNFKYFFGQKSKFFQKNIGNWFFDKKFRVVKCYRPKEGGGVSKISDSSNYYKGQRHKCMQCAYTILGDMIFNFMFQNIYKSASKMLEFGKVDSWKSLLLRQKKSHELGALRSMIHPEVRLHTHQRRIVTSTKATGLLSKTMNDRHRKKHCQIYVIQKCTTLAI